MSDFVERLEQELLAAGRRSPAGRATRRARTTVASSAPLVLSVAVAIVVLVVLVASGITHKRSPAHVTTHPVKPPNVVTPKVTVAPACRVRGTGSRAAFPPLERSTAAPSQALLTMLGSLRRAPTAADRIDVGAINRSPYEVIRVYTRYIRVHTGEKGARIAIVPATICSRPLSFPVRGHITLAPTEVLLMIVLSNPPPRPTVFAGTAADVATAQAIPGLGNDSPRGWLQAAIVPDGVARVVMHFTPPFLHHYSVTMTIRDNVGIAVRRPDYSPTTVSWYAADGHLLRTYTDTAALRYDNCLAAHKKNCR